MSRLSDQAAFIAQKTKGHADKRLIARTTFLTALALLPSCASAKERPVWYPSYFCAGTLGGLYYSGHAVNRSLGFEVSREEYVAADPSTGETFQLDTAVTDCSNTFMQCFVERLPDQETLFAYAVPNELRAGMSYSAGGFDFSTYSLYGVLGPTNAILIDGVSHKTPIFRRLWMIFTPGIGVTDLAFSATPASHGVIDRNFANTSCRLVSETGLFADVKFVK